MPRSIAALALTAALLSCGKELEYRDDSQDRCCAFAVPAGSGSAVVQGHISTDRPGLFERRSPSLTIEYVTLAADAGRLEKLDASLVLNGDSPAPDSVEMSAGYFDAYTSNKFAYEISPAECCNRLDLRIRNDAATYAGDYGPIRFGVRLRKKYTRLTPLPERLSIILDVTTDRGRHQETRPVRLFSYESTGAPFRFH